jgi:hypothetical protein
MSLIFRVLRKQCLARPLLFPGRLSFSSAIDTVASKQQVRPPSPSAVSLDSVLASNDEPHSAAQQMQMTKSARNQAYRLSNRDRIAALQQEWVECEGNEDKAKRRSELYYIRNAAKIKGKTVCLYCIALHCIALHCIALYCIVLYCIVLYCIMLFSSHLERSSTFKKNNPLRAKKIQKKYSEKAADKLREKRRDYWENNKLEMVWPWFWFWFWFWLWIWFSFGFGFNSSFSFSFGFGFHFRFGFWNWI